MLTFTEDKLKAFAKKITEVSRYKSPAPLKYSQVLELATKIFGVEDYSTLGTHFKKEKETEGLVLHSTTLEELKRKAEAERLEKYPPLSLPDLALWEERNGYSIYIYRYMEEEEWFYQSLVQTESSFTGRAFYAPGEKCFSLFVYPCVEDASNDYDICLYDMPGESLYEKFFNILAHLNEKSWMDKDLLLDLQKTMIFVADNKDNLDKVTPRDEKAKQERQELLRKEFEALRHKAQYGGT
jgi:hypothetical protein